MRKQKNILLKIGGSLLITSTLMLNPLNLSQGVASEQDDVRNQGIRQGNLDHVTAGGDIRQTFNKNEGGKGGDNHIHISPAGQSTTLKTAQDYFNEGKDFFRTQQYDEAADYFLNAAGAADQHIKVESFIYLAQCRKQMKDYSGAVVAYNSAIEINKNEDRAHKGLMRIRYELGRVSKLEEKRDKYFIQAFEHYKQMTLTSDSDDEICVELQNLSLGMKSSDVESSSTPSRKGDSLSVNIPAFAKGYEEIYHRFVNGKLVFDNGQGQRKEFPFSQFANTLEGEFDLSGLTADGYDVSTYLSINLGFRRGKNPAHANKVEVWILPKFLMGIDIDGAARHYQSRIWSKWPSDVGILWTWGNWSDVAGDCDYLLNKKFEEITDQNLLNLWHSSLHTSPLLYVSPLWPTAPEPPFAQRFVLIF